MSWAPLANLRLAAAAAAATIIAAAAAAAAAGVITDAAFVDVTVTPTDATEADPAAAGVVLASTLWI